MLRRVAHVRTDVSEERSAPIIRETKISELGTTLVTANVVPSSPILVTLMMGALRSSKRRLLQEPHGVTSQKMQFFIVTAVKTSNLTSIIRQETGIHPIYYGWQNNIYESITRELQNQ
jgi:hypothetical protein